MLKFLLSGFILFVLSFCLANAQDEKTQDIVDIVDYRFDTIRNNINGDIGKIKVELEKIKTMQDKAIEKEVLNIDKSILNIEKRLVNTIVEQDEKIESIYRVWGVGFLLVGLFTAIVSFFIARIYARKAREDAAHEVDAMLDRWIKKEDEEIIDENKREIKKEDELNKQIEFWKNRYEELSFNEDHFLSEFKKWAKNIEDKEIKNRIKKYIKSAKKETK